MNRVLLKNRLIRWLPPLLWMVLIFWISSQPKLPRTEEAFINEILSVTAHFMEYFILSTLWMRALRQQTLELKKATILAALISGIYALTDELHQAFVPGRHPALEDIMVDWLGIFVSVLLGHRLSKKLT